MSYSNPEAYEEFMGRWSARLAPLFVRFAGVEDKQHVLDVGCGTGSLTSALLASATATGVVGIDPAATYVAFAQQRIDDSRAQFEVGSVAALPFPDQSFDAALGLLILQDLADPQRAILEMTRVTRLGGSVATCLWDFQDGMPMLALFWQAAEAVAPDAVARRRAERPRPYHPGLDELTELWVASGLAHVRTSILELALEFSSFEDFWLPFLGGATPTSEFAVTVNKETGGELARALRDELTKVRPDRSLILPARAWAVAGIRDS